MRPRPLIFLHSSDYCGGAERSLCDLAAGLRDRGKRVEVWNAGENPQLARWLEERGLPLRSLPEPSYGTRDLLGSLRHGLVLAGRWLKERPALAHANNITAAKYAAPAAALLRVPLVAHVRDVPRLDGLTRRLLGQAGLVLAISDFIAEALGPIPGTEVAVLHNAIDVPAIELTAPAADPDQPLRLVTPASFRRNKRIDAALDCAAAMREVGCRFHWRVCGPRPDADYAREVELRHSELKLEDCVSLEDSLSQHELYHGANVVVSTAEAEPFGRTVIEGYARGLPLVGFASGALPEIVEPERTGLLVPDGDVGALANVLRRLEGDRDRIVAMGRAGRELAEARFSYEPYLDALEAHHAGLA